MEEITWRIGEHLKEIRNMKRLTLDEAAKITGVSKPMLGQIERGLSSPTINTLWKISAGLKVPLSFFYKQQEAEFQVAKAEDQKSISEEIEGIRLCPLFPFDPVRNVEVFYMELESGVKHISEPHARGLEEYVLVVRGRLKVFVNDREIMLGTKQAMQFRADIRIVPSRDVHFIMWFFISPDIAWGTGPDGSSAGACFHTLSAPSAAVNLVSVP